jgi:hypothetical protein
VVAAVAVTELDRNHCSSFLRFEVHYLFSQHESGRVLRWRQGFDALDSDALFLSPSWQQPGGIHSDSDELALNLFNCSRYPGSLGTGCYRVEFSSFYEDTGAEYVRVLCRLVGSRVLLVWTPQYSV